MLLLFTEDGSDDDKGFALTLVSMQLDLLPSIPNLVTLISGH